MTVSSTLYTIFLNQSQRPLPDNYGKEVGGPGEDSIFYLHTGLLDQFSEASTR
jgi:hypothetical protein